MKPRFCVGEEVKITGTLTSDYDIDRTEVVKSELWDDGLGWRYQTAHQPDYAKWWRESSLKKIPPDDRISFEGCVWQPTDETAGA